MTKYFIAWNADKSEGFITNDRIDAVSARTGKKRRDRGYSSISTVAAAFHEAYEDDKPLPKIQEIEIK